jgi:hypothetical protein
VVAGLGVAGEQRGATIGRPEGSSPLGRLALEITLRGMRPEPRPPGAAGSPGLAGPYA